MTTKRQLISRLKFALKYGWKVPDEILDYVDFEAYVDETLGFYENLYNIIENVKAIREYVERRRKETLLRELSQMELSEVVALLKLIEYVKDTQDDRYMWVIEELEKNGIDEGTLMSVLSVKEIKALAEANVTTNDIITVYIYDQAIVIPREELADMMKETILRRFRREIITKPKPEVLRKGRLFEGEVMKRVRVKLPCKVSQIGVDKIRKFLESFDMRLAYYTNNEIVIEYPEKLEGLVPDVIEDIKRMCPKVRRKIERERKRIEYYEEVYKEAMRYSKLSEKEIDDIVKKALEGIY